MKSTVASGPIPPMIPTIFSRRMGSSAIAGQIELVGIAEQSGGPAGMQEHHVAVLSEESLVHQIDQPVHSLSRIDGIKKNGFGPRHQFQGIAHSRRRNAVTGAD